MEAQQILPNKEVLKVSKPPGLNREDKKSMDSLIDQRVKALVEDLIKEILPPLEKKLVDKIMHEKQAALVMVDEELSGFYGRLDETLMRIGEGLVEMSLRQNALEMEQAGLVQTLVDKVVVAREDLTKGYEEIKSQMDDAAKRAKAQLEEKLKQQVQDEADGVQLSLPSLT